MKKNIGAQAEAIHQTQIHPSQLAEATMKRVVNTIIAPLHWAIAGLAWANAPKRSVDGLQIGVIDDHETSEIVLDRIAAALDLLRATDTGLYQRVLANITRIAVTKYSSAKYWHRFRTCIVGQAEVHSWTTAKLASTIVHEATHAWLRRRGLGATGETLWRIERLCRRAELRFAVKLGDQDLVTWLREQISNWTHIGENRLRWEEWDVRNQGKTPEAR